RVRLQVELTHEAPKPVKSAFKSGAQSPCQALMELLHYQMRQVNVSLKRSKVCLNRVRRAQVTPSWSSSDYQERSVSQSEKRSKVRLNRVPRAQVTGFGA